MNPIDCDVLASGGGMAGTVAAIAAARAGARTVLFERHGFLGGAATAGAVGQFVGWETRAGRRVIAGLAEEIVERLQALGGSSGHGHFVMSTGHRMDRVEYDTEVLKVVLDDMVHEAGVRILLHSQLAQVSRRGRTIAAATVLTKGGLLEIRARQFIDSSGDLDLMARAGAPFLGLADGESLQPATMMFRMGPIDFAAFDGMTAETKAALARRGVAEGALPRAALHCSRVPGSDDGWFNVTRVSIDASDPFALSDGEREGRRQALAAARFIAAQVPGCSRARLVSFAPQLGIRETRRIEGLATLTADDLRRGAEFIDTIARGAYPIDVHHTGDANITFEELGADHVYALPWRIAVPQGLDNALVAGRGLSATHEAHGAIRVMPTAMAVAQAIGTGAALLAASNAPAAGLDPATLREKLRDAGAIL